MRCLSTNLRPHWWILLVLLFSTLHWALAPMLVMAQEMRASQSQDSSSPTPGGPLGGSEPANQHEEPQKHASQKRAAFVVAPLPISSPAVGSGVVPVLAYIFPTSSSDKTSPPSVVGAVGLVTDNGSRALALGGEVYFKKNSYRTTTIYARGNLNYDLYGLGSGDSQPRLPLKQTGQSVFEEFLRRTWWKLFLGPRFLWGSSLITVRPNNLGTAPLHPTLDSIPI